MMQGHGFRGATFVVRLDDAAADRAGSTLIADLFFLVEREVRPIVVAPHRSSARAFVRLVNRTTNAAVSLSGADAGMIPAVPTCGIGRVRTEILSTLLDAGYIPVVEPTALGFAGREVAIEPNAVASHIGAATHAARVLFFDPAGGVIDPKTEALIGELTPAEALDLAAAPILPQTLRAAIRAAAEGVRAGVGAAQIIDGRIAHATIIEFLTEQHLGTQVAGSLYLGAA
jgi:acetylglutamate kinase